MDAAEQQIKELREDLNRRFDQLVEMIRKGVPLLPMKEIHLKKRKMFIKEGEVILEQDRHNMLFNVLQEGQFMLKLLKVKNMMMPLKNQSLRILESTQPYICKRYIQGES